MKFAVILLLFSGFFTFAAAQSGNTRPSLVVPEPSPTPNVKDAGDGDVLKVETSLVTIPVSVTDARGRFVSNLTKQDFKVFEDGKAQEIEYFGAAEQPITVALVLDTSPSTELRIEQIQNAAVAFINQLKFNDRVMVIEFDENIHVLSEATSDRKKLEKAIRKADFGDGTSIYEAVADVVNRRLAKVEGRKAVVMFTDGVDTTSYKYDDAASLEAAEKGQAPFYTVYYDTLSDYAKNVVNRSDEDEPAAARGTTPQEYEDGKKYLLALTGKTGGKIYSADANRNLDQTFSEIAAELKQLYSLGYYPTEAGKIGQRKQIQVQIEKSAFTVRARESYIVGGEPKPAAPGKKKNRLF